MRQYDKQEYFNKANGGLDYIQEVYPQSRGLENKKKGFKIRNEHTGSAMLYDEKGVFYVKDFGDSNKAMNAIDLCMQEENLKFIEALQFLYQHAGLEAASLQQFKAIREHKATDLDSKHYEVTYFDAPIHTTVFAPFLDESTCNDYNLRSVESYEYVTFRKDAAGNATADKILNTVVATDNYPIFAFVEDSFIKIYEPKNDKAYRFRFFGTKPARFIYGWQRLFDSVDVELIKDLRRRIKDAGDEAKYKKTLQAELDELLLDNVIIASGGSDGLNIASLGYDVIWFNNETEQISYKEYQELKSICKEIYNLPDIDSTGIRQGVKIGLEHLDMKTIWLPEKLKESNKKDFRDWISNYKHLGLEKTQDAFAGLMKLAMEFRWWRWNKKTATYKYNYVSLLYFLEHQGFFAFNMKHKNQQKGTSNYIFIKIDGNIVREVTAPEIKTFVQRWLRDNQVNLEVLNMVISSQFLNDKSLLSLPCKEIDFSVATQKDQLFFFNNKTVRISGSSIETVDQDKLKNFTWLDKVIKHDIKLKEPQFTIAKDASGNWDIELIEKNNMFLNYLINASRIHWRNELETPFNGKSEKLKTDYHNNNRFNIAGPNLTIDEKHEQKQHLINKIYAIGYMLHSYKDDAKPWCVYVMDNKIPDVISESHGGSGKSFGISKILQHLKNSFYMEGRNSRLLDNQFVYDGVDEDTDFIFVDDAHYSLNFGFFFSPLTGSLRVNPKHGKSFEIPFEHSPKIGITTNFVPANLDPSTLRRLLFMVYSDYYHEKNHEYQETRQITDDFGGKKMFKEDFTKEDYNLFYNFCLQALQFYLSCNEKINAPDGNVKKRNLMQMMGDNFFEWAKGYFGDDKLNAYIPRKDAQEDYKSFVGGKTMSVNKQKIALDAFCKINGWQFNPIELQGSDKTIKKPITDYNGKRQIVEHYYINTTGAAVVPIDDDPFATNVATNEAEGSKDIDTDIQF